LKKRSQKIRQEIQGKKNRGKIDQKKAGTGLGIAEEGTEEPAGTKVLDIKGRYGAMGMDPQKGTVRKNPTKQES